MYIDWDQFNQLYDLEWQTKRTQSINTIVQKLMLVSRKVMEQRQEARAKMLQMQVPRRMDSSLSDKHKHNDHNTNKLQQYKYDDHDTIKL